VASRGAELVRAMVASRGVSLFVYHDPLPEALDAHLTWLVTRYAFVPIGTACDAIAAGAVVDLGRHPAVLTIDDGRRGNRLLVDVLRRHRVRPCLYLCSALVGTGRAYWDDLVQARAPDRLRSFKRMTERERRAALATDFGMAYEQDQDAPSALSHADLAALTPHVDVGSHGRFHQPMRFLSATERAAELRGSKAEIEALVGRPCEHFALPSGAYDAATLQAVAAAGYRSCRTAQPYVNARPCDLAALGAFGIGDDADAVTLQVQSAGLSSLVRRGFVRRRTQDSIFD